MPPKKRLQSSSNTASLPSNNLSTYDEIPVVSHPNHDDGTGVSASPTAAGANGGPAAGTKSDKPVKPRKKRDDYYSRRDFTKPFPIGCHLFCRHDSTGLYYGALVVDRRKHDPVTGVVIPDPELELYYKHRQKPHKKRRGASEKVQVVEEEEEGGEELDSGGDVYDSNQVHKVPEVYYTSHHYSYYIHYVNWDRRMDEWVDKDRLLLPEFVEDSQIFPLTLPPIPDFRIADLQQHSPKPLPNETRVERLERQIDEVQLAMCLISHGNFSLEDILSHEDATRVKNVNTIHLGKYILDAWYFSPYPPELCKTGILHICEFCLSPFASAKDLERHSETCTIRHPPGNEIYRSTERNVVVAAFEVDGSRETLFCENLSLLAKLFLDHKTLEYDCTPFLFYVICELDASGYHIVGYFSKEKESVARYNLACILALPCYQRKGYGRFLISLSYELSKIEKKHGSPEKPISDLGQRSYNSYWSNTLLKLLSTSKEYDTVSILDLANATSIEPNDIIETLKLLKLLVYYRDGYVISYNRLQQLLAEQEQSRAKRNALVEKSPHLAMVAECRSEAIRWSPYIYKAP